MVQLVDENWRAALARLLNELAVLARIGRDALAVEVARKEAETKKGWRP